MRNKYGIGFFTTAIIAVLVITCAYQLSFQKAKEAAKERAKKQQMELMEEQEFSVEADGNALKDGCYYLMEVNGYVVVYLSDKKTAYEYTDILFDELPAVLRDEIRNGKYVESAEALYGFLENYSS